jgi:hypothetical protein
MPQQPDPLDINELECALKTLRPAARLDRDQLLFEAGRASVRRGWFWQTWSAATTAAACVLAAMLLLRGTPEPIEKVIVVQVPQPPAAGTTEPESRSPLAALPTVEPGPEVSGAAALSYWQLRDKVLRWGIDSLPAPLPAAAVREDSGVSSRRFDEFFSNKIRASIPAGFGNK